MKELGGVRGQGYSELGSHRPVQGSIRPSVPVLEGIFFESGPEHRLFQGLS